MLIELMPERYANSPETVEIQKAIEVEIQKIVQAYDQMLLQLFVVSSDEWLPLWEKMYGITPDNTNTEYRRSRIMSKMRGNGTTTVEMIKNVCESFYNGQVQIIEHFDQYSFDVSFLSSIGVPPNLEDMTAAIEEIKPAHLTYQYLISFNRYQDLLRYTHTQLTPYTHQQLREEEIIIGN